MDVQTAVIYAYLAVAQIAAIYAYLAVGQIATLYVLIMFFITGYNVFDAPKKPVMPMRYKVSYVLVMAVMFPFFYCIFYKEILALRKNARVGEQDVSLG